MMMDALIDRRGWMGLLSRGCGLWEGRGVGLGGGNALLVEWYGTGMAWFRIFGGGEMVRESWGWLMSASGGVERNNYNEEDINKRIKNILPE